MHVSRHLSKHKHTQAHPPLVCRDPLGGHTEDHDMKLGRITSEKRVLSHLLSEVMSTYSHSYSSFPL